MYQINQPTKEMEVRTMRKLFVYATALVMVCVMATGVAGGSVAAAYEASDCTVVQPLEEPMREPEKI